MRPPFKGRGEDVGVAESLEDILLSLRCDDVDASKLRFSKALLRTLLHSTLRAD